MNSGLIDLAKCYGSVYSLQRLASINSVRVFNMKFDDIVTLNLIYKTALLEFVANQTVKLGRPGLITRIGQFASEKSPTRRDWRVFILLAFQIQEGNIQRPKRWPFPYNA